MKKIYSLTNYFLKVFLAFKINFLALLIIPVVSIIYQQSDSLFQKIPAADYYAYLSLWLAYLVTITGFSIGYEIVLLREQQFLKQMKFIVKDIEAVLYAKILTHLILLLGTVIILAAFSRLLFFVPFFSTLLFSLGSILFPFLPLSFLFLVLNLLPIHTENLQPIITFTTMAMLFYLNFMDIFSASTSLLIFINPMNFALEAGKIWSQLFLTGIQINLTAVGLASIFYLAIGYYALKNTRILANFRI